MTHQFHMERTYEFSFDSNFADGNDTETQYSRDS